MAVTRNKETNTQAKTPLKVLQTNGQSLLTSNETMLKNNTFVISER
jgi:hypothetical protein